MGFLKNLFNKPPKPGKPRPITDQSFQQEVLAAGTAAAVNFWSPRCPHCQVMSGLLEEIGPEYVGRVNLFKLNVLQNPTSAMQYQVQGTPTLVLFRKGRAVDRIVGLMPLNPLRNRLDSLAR